MQTPSALVVTDRQIILQRCALYRTHWCAVLNVHHICPKSWFENARVPVDTPMISLCPDCHANVHAVIDARIRGLDADFLPLRCQKLADRAFEIAHLKNLVPELTL